MYLWTGPIDQMPSCKALGLSDKDFGFTEAVAPNVCPVCTCDAPIVSCSPPTSFAAATALTCPLGGSMISFDAPPGWDGSCDKSNPLLGGQGMHAMESGPVKKQVQGCTPHASAVPPEDNDIQFTAALACAGDSVQGCPDGEYCLSNMDASPHASPPDGFIACVAAAGDLVCPPEYEDERYIVYHTFIDSRTCSPCDCGAPSGSHCLMQLYFYQNDSCGGKETIAWLIDEQKTYCGNIPEDLTFLSKSAPIVEVMPGSCQPNGGAPSGNVVGNPATQTTYCCRRPTY